MAQPNSCQNGSQELWDHCKHHKWVLESMFSHVYRLTDGPCSTKEVIEDLFGHAADARRHNKNPFKTHSTLHGCVWIKKNGHL